MSPRRADVTTRPAGPSREQHRVPPVRRARSQLAPRSLSGVLRPHHQRAPRHHRPRLPAVRRGVRRRDDQQVQAGPVRRRGADRADRGGHRGARQRAGGGLPRPAGRLLQAARHPRHRQGPARGQRLRLRAADGPDEQRPVRCGDALRPHQPRLQLPVLQPGQGGRPMGRRHLPLGPGAGARCAQRQSSGSSRLRRCGRPEEARRDRRGRRERALHADVGLLRGQPGRAARHARRGLRSAARLAVPGPGTARRPRADGRRRPAPRPSGSSSPRTRNAARWSPTPRSPGSPRRRPTGSSPRPAARPRRSAPRPTTTSTASSPTSRWSSPRPSARSTAAARSCSAATRTDDGRATTRTTRGPRAQRRPRELRRRADDYVDAKLRAFEAVLAKTLEAVGRGRHKLTGHNPIDDLAAHMAAAGRRGGRPERHRQSDADFLAGLAAPAGAAEQADLTQTATTPPPAAAASAGPVPQQQPDPGYGYRQQEAYPQPRRLPAAGARRLPAAAGVRPAGRLRAIRYARPAGLPAGPPGQGYDYPQQPQQQGYDQQYAAPPTTGAAGRLRPGGSPADPVPAAGPAVPAAARGAGRDQLLRHQHDRPQPAAGARTGPVTRAARRPRSAARKARLGRGRRVQYPDSSGRVTYRRFGLPARSVEARPVARPHRGKQEALNARLDHRDPLVFDTRELGRRPGAMKKVSRSVPAPEDLGIADVIGVPRGRGRRAGTPAGVGHGGCARHRHRPCTGHGGVRKVSGAGRARARRGLPGDVLLPRRRHPDRPQGRSR